MSILDFELIDDIGKGSFGSVHKVKRIKDNQIYALKRVKLSKLNNKEKNNSINEIRLLASINHQNIISYKESFYDEITNVLCIIMEYADNGDLEEKLNKKIKLNEIFEEIEIWSVLIQLLKGLKELHDRKILHRDIKSANIFLNKDGYVKIGDLNVSKVYKESLKNTQTGTPFYASPEVWKNEPYDYKSDIWSLGCMIYELCTHKPPFTGNSMNAVYNNVIKGKYENIPLYYSDGLKTIVNCMLQINPIKRVSSNDILNILQEKMLDIGLNNKINEFKYMDNFSKFINRKDSCCNDDFPINKNFNYLDNFLVNFTKFDYDDKNYYEGISNKFDLIKGSNFLIFKNLNFNNINFLNRLTNNNEELNIMLVEFYKSLSSINISSFINKINNQLNFQNNNDVQYIYNKSKQSNKRICSAIVQPNKRFIRNKLFGNINKSSNFIKNESLIKTIYLPKKIYELNKLLPKKQYKLLSNSYLDKNKSNMISSSNNNTYENVNETNCNDNMNNNPKDIKLRVRNSFKKHSRNNNSIFNNLNPNIISNVNLTENKAQINMIKPKNYHYLKNNMYDFNSIQFKTLQNNNGLKKNNDNTNLNINSLNIHYYNNQPNIVDYNNVVNNKENESNCRIYNLNQNNTNKLNINFSKLKRINHKIPNYNLIPNNLDNQKSSNLVIKTNNNSSNKDVHNIISNINNNQKIRSFSSKVLKNSNNENSVKEENIIITNKDKEYIRNNLINNNILDINKISNYNVKSNLELNKVYLSRFTNSKDKDLPMIKSNKDILSKKDFNDTQKNIVNNKLYNNYYNQLKSKEEYYNNIKKNYIDHINIQNKNSSNINYDKKSRNLNSNFNIINNTDNYCINNIILNNKNLKNDNSNYLAINSSDKNLISYFNNNIIGNSNTNKIHNNNYFNKGYNVNSSKFNNNYYSKNAVNNNCNIGYHNYNNNNINYNYSNYLNKKETPFKVNTNIS